MMVQQKDHDELGLSLSLSFPGSSGTDQHNMNNSINNNNQTADVASSPLELNLMMPSMPFSLLRNNTWAPDSLDRKMQSCRVERRSSLNGIDVNRLPAAAMVVVIDDEAGVSSPNSTLSSLSGNKRSVINERYEVANGEDLLDCSRSEDEDGDNSRKKLRLSKEQSAILEESFKEHNTLNPKQKVALAKRLGLRPRQVEVWFQNRRARTKLKQTEVDCEFLKRCCQTLTEENRKLQKEVQELRALKLSPQFYTQMAPPTTLTMCPSCERVAGPPAATSSIVPSSSVGLLTKPAAPPRPNPVSTNQHRLPFNLWASPPIANRPIDAFHPQS